MKKLFGHRKKPVQEWMPYDDNGYDWDEEDDYQEEQGEYETSDDSEEYVEYYRDTEDVEEGYTEETGYPGEAEAYYGEPEYPQEPGAYYGEAEYPQEPEAYYEEAEYAQEPEAYYGEPEYPGEAEAYYGEAEYPGEAEAYYGEAEYSQEPGEYYEEIEYIEEPGAYYEETEYQQARDNQKKAGGKRKKGNMSGIDMAIMVTGAAILVIALFIGGIYLRSRVIENQKSEFVSVGSQLDGITMIGEKGLLAVADAELAKLAAATAVVEEQRQEEEENQEQNYDENDYDKSAVVKMSLTSVQKDLKLKFSNRETGKLVANVPFSVEVTKPDKSRETWTDDDLDGIIYKKNLEPGSYSVAMQELTDEKYSKYLIATTGQAVEVQKDISYEKVDVSNEIKKESEVDVAAEDTEKKETAIESTLPDTVEWVASSVTPGAYTEVPKSEIPPPGPVTTAKAFLPMAESISTESQYLTVGDSFLLEAFYTDDDTDEEIPFAALAWSSDNNQVATVDREGRVQAVGIGTAMISYFGVVIVDGEEIECSDYCMIMVTSTSGGVVTVDQTELNMNAGETRTAKATAAGFTEGRTLSYSITSDNSAVATAQIDNSGNISITAVGSGQANLNVVVNYSDGGKDTEARVSVKVKVEGDGGLNISLNHTAVTLGISEKVVLEAAIGNAISPIKTVTAESSDVTVATVSAEGCNVTVSGVGVGSAVITVKFAEGPYQVSAACTVTVRSDSTQDKSTKLLDYNHNQVYVLEGEKYREAVLADYYAFDKFFRMDGQKYTGWQTIEGRVYYYDARGERVTGEQVIQGLKYNFGSDGALVSDSGTMGIDVSKWNGSIDWNAVKNSGISYVIIRCGYRGSSQGALIEDSLFATNIKGANEAGLKVGVYFFTQAIDEVEAVYEASFVLEKIKNYKITYPVFLDVEPSGGRGDRLDKAARTAVCKAFCETIRGAGYTAGIYANKTWLTEKIDGGQLSAYKIWLAQYAAAPSYSGKYDIWQYKSTGRVSGISGDVDLNTSYLGY
ncbi:MAG: Ig-like domain-containing protein [Roseburia sp.]|nr:Ig-like domain-containing protein [Roseburia sp.]